MVAGCGDLGLSRYARASFPGQCRRHCQSHSGLAVNSNSFVSLSWQPLADLSCERSGAGAPRPGLLKRGLDCGVMLAGSGVLQVIHWLLRVVVSASELLHNSLNGNFKAAGWLFCMLLCIGRANQTVDCQTCTLYTRSRYGRSIWRHGAELTGASMSGTAAHVVPCHAAHHGCCQQLCSQRRWLSDGASMYIAAPGWFI